MFDKMKEKKNGCMADLRHSAEPEAAVFGCIDADDGALGVLPKL